MLVSARSVLLVACLLAAYTSLPHANDPLCQRPTMAQRMLVHTIILKAHCDTLRVDAVPLRGGTPDASTSQPVKLILLYVCRISIFECNWTQRRGKSTHTLAASPQHFTRVSADRADGCNGMQCVWKRSGGTCAISSCKMRYAAQIQVQIPIQNILVTKRNKLQAQWVHLTNHAAGHSRPGTAHLTASRE